MSDDATHVQPESLLHGFARSPAMTAFILGLVVHVVLIGGTSIGYVWDTWVDPEAARQRKEAVENAKKAQAEAELAAAQKAKERLQAEAKPGDGKPGEAKPGEAEARPVGPDGVPEAVKQTEIYKKVTEEAKPGELPTAPNTDDKLMDLDKIGN